MRHDLADVRWAPKGMGGHGDLAGHPTRITEGRTLEVVVWQLGIIAVVVASWFWSRRAAFWVCTILTIWTLAMLFYAPLIAIQLAAIWGTWWLLRDRSRKKDQISVRDEIIQRLSSEARLAVQETPRERTRVVVGREHLRHMNKHIREATDAIVILSGWVSDGVIDDKFLALLDQRLRAGCDVYIGYGYEDSQGRHNQSHAGARALRKLAGLQQSHKETLRILQFATHEKMLVTDDTVVYGSNNWLSNSAFRNAERSLAVVNPHLAQRERTRVQQLFGAT